MSYALLRDSWPIARKKHRCIWCGEFILVGEKYRREQSVYDGEFQNHAWHPECNTDAQDYFLEFGDEEFSAYSAERPKRIAA